MGLLRLVGRVLLLSAFFVFPVVLTGGLGLLRSVNGSMPRPAQAPAAETMPAAPVHDPRKPTVAIALGRQVHEVTDTLGPYAIFARSGLYNVYMVAADSAARPVGTRTAFTLSSALDLFPHLTFEQLDALLPAGPEILVVPQMAGAAGAANEDLREYIRRQAARGAIVFSWCTGAGVLAASGLLDGKPATTHWGDIDRLEQAFPQVRWQRGVRYVDQGRLITTGGLTQGIAATFYLLGRLHGPELAGRLAAELHYAAPDLQQTAPAVRQHRFGPEDSIYLLNAAFNWSKRNVGVWIYDGIDELELSAALDAEPSSLTARTYSAAAQRRVLRSRYGLWLRPHWAADRLPALAHLLVPGAPGPGRTAEELLPFAGSSDKLVYLHSGPQSRPCFAAPLELLARSESVPTAAFAAKRLEYREASLKLEGAGWPLLLSLQPLAIGLAGMLIGQALLQRFTRRRSAQAAHRPGPGAQ